MSGKEAEKLYSDREIHLGAMPGHILLSLARNEAAELRWRKAAIRIMLDKGYPEFKHPELVLLLHEVQADMRAEKEVEAQLEAAMEAPIEDHPIIGQSFENRSKLFDLRDSEVQQPKWVEDSPVPVHKLSKDEL